jgi:hypothetical protein
VLQKKKKKRSEDGEIIDGLNDESSQMSDVRVTVMETATGELKLMLSLKLSPLNCFQCVPHSN